MRALIAIAAAVMMMLALLPGAASAAEIPISDVLEMVEDGEEIDEQARSIVLDDDVLHSLPLVCPPPFVMRWRDHAFELHPDGRVPLRTTRPPRAG